MYVYVWNLNDALIKQQNPKKRAPLFQVEVKTCSCLKWSSRSTYENQCGAYIDAQRDDLTPTSGAALCYWKFLQGVDRYSLWAHCLRDNICLIGCQPVDFFHTKVNSAVTRARGLKLLCTLTLMRVFAKWIAMIQKEGTYYLILFLYQQKIIISLRVAICNSFKENWPIRLSLGQKKN